jgi:UDP-glucose 4-epimerase
MRHLITGGSGFIGSHLADELIGRGELVHVLDDLTTGSIDNIRHLRGRPGFEYTIDTSSNTSLVAELVDEADIVYHLAAAVGVGLIVESPVRTIETNVHCTEVVLAQASKKKKPVFLASTSEVYGKSERLPYREDDDILLGPTSTARWSYACSKAIDEFLALSYWRERRLPVVVGRFFNTVGPRQTGRYGMVIPTFVEQALDERPISVYGDGTQRRCFCHVADVVNAVIGLMRCQEAYGDVFNVGSTEEISIWDLAVCVREMTASNSEIVKVPYDEAYEEGFEDMVRRIPDIAKVHRLLGWQPTRTLEEILADVVASHRAGHATELAMAHATRHPH